MKKNKFISILLAFIMVLAPVSNAFAAEDNSVTVAIDLNGVPLTEGQYNMGQPSLVSSDGQEVPGQYTANGFVFSGLESSVYRLSYSAPANLVPDANIEVEPYQTTLDFTDTTGYNNVVTISINSTPIEEEPAPEEPVEEEPVELPEESVEVPGEPTPGEGEEPVEPTPEEPEVEEPVVEEPVDGRIREAMTAAQEIIDLGNGVSRTFLELSLERIGYSEHEAFRALDSMQVDYNEQARIRALSHLIINPNYEYSVLVELLVEGNGFTQEQAEFGARAALGEEPEEPEPPIIREDEFVVKLIDYTLLMGGYTEELMESVTIRLRDAEGNIIEPDRIVDNKYVFKGIEREEIYSALMTLPAVYEIVKPVDYPHVFKVSEEIAKEYEAVDITADDNFIIELNAEEELSRNLYIMKESVDLRILNPKVVQRDGRTIAYEGDLRPRVIHETGIEILPERESNGYYYYFIPKGTTYTVRYQLPSGFEELPSRLAGKSTIVNGAERTASITETLEIKIYKDVVIAEPEPPVVEPEPPVVEPEPPVIVEPEPPVIEPEPPVIVEPEPPIVRPEPPVINPEPRPDRPTPPPIIDDREYIIDPSQPKYVERTLEVALGEVGNPNSILRGTVPMAVDVENPDRYIKNPNYGKPITGESDGLYIFAGSLLATGAVLLVLTKKKQKSEEA